MRWLDGITDTIDLSSSEFWEMVKARQSGVLQSMGLQRVRHNCVTEQQQQQNLANLVSNAPVAMGQSVL